MRSLVASITAAACTSAASAGLPLCIPDEIELSLAGLPILPFGGEYLLAFPPSGTISGASITLNFTTAGSFQAQDLVFELAGPTGGILLIGGRDLRWQGQGSFTATINTANVNGSLQAEGPISYWFMNVSPTAESLPQPVEGTWDARSEVRFGFDPRPYWCAADINADGDATVQDIYDFLSCFAAGRGDFNGEDGTTVQDIYDYLSAWTSGCPCGPGEC